MDEVVDPKGQGKGGSRWGGLGLEADVQLVAQAFAEVEPQPGGVWGGPAAILTGKAFVKNARQVPGINADAVVLQREGQCILVPDGAEGEDRRVPPVFYRVADELIEDEAKPFFIGKYGVLRLMHLKGDPVLQQERLVLPYGLVDCVKEPEFPDEIVLFRVFAAGVVEGLLGVAINGLQGGQQCRGSGAGFRRGACWRRWGF